MKDINNIEDQPIVINLDNVDNNSYLLTSLFAPYSDGNSQSNLSLVDKGSFKAITGFEKNDDIKLVPDMSDKEILEFLRFKPDLNRISFSYPKGDNVYFLDEILTRLKNVVKLEIDCEELVNPQQLLDKLNKLSNLQEISLKNVKDSLNITAESFPKNIKKISIHQTSFDESSIKDIYQYNSLESLSLDIEELDYQVGNLPNSLKELSFVGREDNMYLLEIATNLDKVKIIKAILGKDNVIDVNNFKDLSELSITGTVVNNGSNIEFFAGVDLSGLNECTRIKKLNIFGCRVEKFPDFIPEDLEEAKFDNSFLDKDMQKMLLDHSVDSINNNNKFDFNIGLTRQYSYEIARKYNYLVEAYDNVELFEKTIKKLFGEEREHQCEAVLQLMEQKKLSSFLERLAESEVDCPFHSNDLEVIYENYKTIKALEPYFGVSKEFGINI